MKNSITITLRVRRTPGGRGRNATHWEGITQNENWWQCERSPNEYVVIGRLVRRHLMSGEKSVLVSIKYEQYKEEKNDDDD